LARFPVFQRALDHLLRSFTLSQLFDTAQGLDMMLLFQNLLHTLLLLSTASSTLAATSWGFTDATVSVQAKGSGVAGGYKEKSGNLSLSKLAI